MSGFESIGFDADSVVASLSGTSKVLLQNIGVKTVSGAQLVDAASNPNYLYFLQDVNSLAVYINNETYGKLWMGASGYPVAGSSSLRDSINPPDGFFYYNTTTSFVEQYIGGVWSAVNGGYTSLDAPTYIPFTGTITGRVGSKYKASSMAAVLRLPESTDLIEGHVIEVVGISDEAVTNLVGPKVVGEGGNLWVFNPQTETIELTFEVVLQVGVLYKFIVQSSGQWLMHTSQLPASVTVYDMEGFDPAQFIAAAIVGAVGNQLLQADTPEEAVTALGLGDASAKTIGTGAGNISTNEMLDEKFAKEIALGERGTTGAGKLVAEGFAGIGAVTSSSNWDAVLNGGSRFMSGGVNSLLEDTGTAGISVSAQEGASTYQVQFGGRASRFFGRTAEAAIPAPAVEFRTVPGTTDNVIQNYFGLAASSYRTVGEWPVTSEVEGLPEASDGVLKVSGPQTLEAGYRVVQEFLPYSSTTPKHYYRTSLAGVFSGWASALTTAGLGTAAARDVGEAAGNVQLVGSFQGPTGTQNYWHSGNMLGLGTTPAAARTSLELKALAVLDKITNAQWDSDGDALAVTNGGTGGKNPLAARNALELGASNNVTFSQVTATLNSAPSSWNNQNSATTVGAIGWRNFGNNHIIQDISNGVAMISGVAKSKIQAELPWSENYPMLVGHNGNETYGVKVDTSRTTGIAGTGAPTGYGIALEGDLYFQY